MKTAKPDDSIERSAILMMSLGEDAAAEVFRHLSPREVQQLSTAMASLKQLTRADMDEALESFRQEADQFMAVALDSNAYIRSVLNKALGSDRAAAPIEYFPAMASWRGDWSGRGSCCAALRSLWGRLR